jgi:hypothetical protein
MKSRFGGVLVSLAIVCSSLSTAMAQSQYQYSTPMPPGIASPDKVETRLGTLRFFDGFPDKATVEKLYDNLDFQRAVQAYLLALPPVSQVANRKAILELGPANTTVPIFEQLMDSRSIFLTANDNTVYSWMWIDLRSGPLVLETPPRVLGTINDMWYRWVVDIGFTGRTRPGRQVPAAARLQAVPDGSFHRQSPTFSVWAPWRSFLSAARSRAWTSSRSSRKSIHSAKRAMRRP